MPAISLLVSEFKILKHKKMEEQTNDGSNQTLAATTRLYEAALMGDVNSLRNLILEDPLILDRCIIEKSSRYMQSPLHVATNMQRLDFVAEISSRKPELAEVVDRLKRSSPLHLASSNGHLQIVETLLVAKPNMCLVHDQDGMTPIHVAAINGQISVLGMLHHWNPFATRERTNSGETVLHLCIKHKQTKALEFLLDRTDDELLLNSKDGDGNTALHLAVIGKGHEMVELLVKCKKIDINAVNNKELTALNCHLLGRKRERLCWHRVMVWEDGDEIGPSLEAAKALEAKYALKIKNKNKWVEKQRNALMVAASLIATMAFQVVISPPGGFSQDTNGAGKAILEGIFGWKLLVISNTIALASSLSVILLLISGLPCGPLFVGVLRIKMWTAVTATTLTYFASMAITTTLTPLFTLIAWLCLLGTLVFAHTFHFLVKFIIKRPILRSIFIRCCHPTCNNADPV